MKQETEHLHADGDEEEDECVCPLICDQQLGEDARQGDNDPGCTWGERRRLSQDKEDKEKYTTQSEEEADRDDNRDRDECLQFFVCVSILTLSSHHPLCVPLGQHPHVTIETGLLNWGGRRKPVSVQTVA